MKYICKHTSLTNLNLEVYKIFLDRNILKINLVYLFIGELQFIIQINYI